MVETNTDNASETKREAARLAMEGPERTAKREGEEKERATREALAEIDKRLATVTHDKEELELAWIDLDNTRKAIRGLVNPLQDEEKKIEEEETAIELEESRIGLPTDKHKVEEKRWATQERRKNVEQKRWAEEEKLSKIEKNIEASTARYRTLLDEEETLVAKRARAVIEPTI